MEVPDSTSVAALVSRARRAGASGASGFADWLIIDEEWFGPCAAMDTPTYERWRRRAVEIYQGPHDLYVSSKSLFTHAEAAGTAIQEVGSPPRQNGKANAVVRALSIGLAALLLVALAALGAAMVGDPPAEGPPETGEPKSCTGLPIASCAGGFSRVTDGAGSVGRTAE